MIVVGLVGMPHAGKGTIAKLIRENLEEWFEGKITIAAPRFSDYPREHLARHGIPITRDTMQKFVQDMERHALARGEEAGALSREVKKRIELLKDTDVVLVDGVRWLTDETMIRSFPNNIMVFVKASPEIRFVRVRKAEENTGDAEKTWEEFLTEDNALNEQFIEEISGRADVHIENDGDYTNLQEQVIHFVYSRIALPLELQLLKLGTDSH